ncbi:hypothetical protein [Labrenzia sp. OB1]|uniref:hypothetical protein n=1 Tax=Labrenzia sp. OB1 TaxID=1561204 RepID=UPI000AF4F1F8|nr:hypothetical protein [Labrenzia sp. OB1]
MRPISTTSRVPFIGSISSTLFKKVPRSVNSSPFRFSKNPFKRHVQKYSTLPKKIETIFSKTPNLLKNFKEKNLRNSAEEAINKFIKGGLEKENTNMIIQGFNKLKKIDGRMPKHMSIKKEVVNKADFISACLLNENKKLLSSNGSYREQMKKIAEMNKETKIIINKYLEQASNYHQRNVNSDIEKVQILALKAQQKIDSNFVLDPKFISQKKSARKKNSEQHKETIKILKSIEKNIKNTLAVKNKEIEEINRIISGPPKEYNKESAQKDLSCLRDNLNWAAKMAKEIIDLDPDGLLLYSDLAALPSVDLQAFSGKVGEMYRELDQAIW